MTIGPTRRRLLLFADFACHTGFARVAESVAKHWLERWDISVLALNYHGDPTPHQQFFRLYVPALGGDMYGYNRVQSVVAAVQPDLICIVNDPWVCAEYLKRLPVDAPPVVLYMPVDGPRLSPTYVRPLNRAAHAVAYTQFGLAELRRAGLTIPASVLPHGIDPALFHPVPQAEARARAGMDPDTYAVLVLDRNQHRKHLDLAFEAFARFAEGKPPTVKLWYHGAVDDEGWSIEDLANSFDIGDRLLLTHRDLTATRGIPLADLKYVYSAADMKLSTTGGEGWGLTTMEAMACGVPCIVPRFSALGEWTDDQVVYTPVERVRVHTGGMNTRYGEINPAVVATQLDELYASAAVRHRIGEAGRQRVTQERFSWSTIAAQFEAVFDQALAGRTEQPARRIVHAIPYVNRPDLLRQAVDSTASLHAHTIIIDNSPEGLTPNDWPVAIVRPIVPLTFAQTQTMMQALARQADADALIFQHNDCALSPEALARFLATLDQALVSGERWGVIFTAYDACCAYSRAAIETVGPWDPQIPWYFADNDWYRRLDLAGFSRIEAGGQGVTHHASQTLNASDELALTTSIQTQLSAQYYRAKWGGPAHHEVDTVPFATLLARLDRQEVACADA